MDDVSVGVLVLIGLACLPVLWIGILRILPDRSDARNGFRRSLDRHHPPPHHHIPYIPSSYIPPSDFSGPDTGGGM